MRNNEPLVIERRVACPDRGRKVIIQHLPAPPPKPRDIILEKWLPKEAASQHHHQRQIYLQKGSSVPLGNYRHHHHHQHHQPVFSQTQQPYVYSKPIYEEFDQSKHPRRGEIYEMIDRGLSQSLNGIKPPPLGKPMKHSDSSEMLPPPQPKVYAPHGSSFYSTAGPSPYQKHHAPHAATSEVKKQPKVAGYRVIRQIIPGPHSSQADIDRALSRGSSQRSNNSSVHHKQPYMANQTEFFKHQASNQNGSMSAKQLNGYKSTANQPEMNRSSSIDKF